MPNHITNRLKIIGTTEQINKVFDFIKMEEIEQKEREIDNRFGLATIDFNKITPMPKWVFQGNLGNKEKEKYGETNCWYDWSIQNWGTKWNAYSQPDDRTTEDTIYFQTAWSGVPDLIQKLAWIFPDVSIEYSFFDEDLGHNVARFLFKDTEKPVIYAPTGGSKKAYELAFEIDQSSAEDNNLKFDKSINNYVYDEE